MDYTKHTTNKVATPQTKKVPGVKKQRKNNAGGVSFKLNKWDYLMRFLILGTEGGTYYVSEGKLTRDAAKNVEDCIVKDGKRAVDTIVQVSHDGRAANNDAAIFALALAASTQSPVTRDYALQNLAKVCRIGTHLFHFIAYVKTMRGFGRGLREGISRWYTAKTPDQLAYQMLKYQQRDGWAHRDVLRQAHPFPLTKEQDKLFEYAVGKRDKVPKVSDFAKGVRKVQDGGQINIPSLIRKHNLTREVLPTEALNDLQVWEALLERMPVGALIRNLGKMASMGMHKHFTATEGLTVKRLLNEDNIKRGRVHPLALMNALYVYKQGRGIRGSLQWGPSQKVIDAIEEAFYLSFKHVEPTNKNTMLALDVSGSMGWHCPGNMPLMSCRDASAILAMVTMRTEPNTFLAGFTAAGSKRYSHTGGGGYGHSNGISTLPISRKSTLGEVIRTVDGLPFGSTDCALPMLYCKHLKLDVDTIVIYTDNETWAGRVHPWQALDDLEQVLGHQVKLVVVGMVATRFSIAKPGMDNMLDVVGFDTHTPAAISNFAR